MTHTRWITTKHRRECQQEGHDWGDTVEHDECGDDRCGVQCNRCLYIEWACDDA
jgi:hypothetical protein